MPWSADLAEIYQQLQVEENSGLSADEAERRLLETGLNQIDQGPKISPFVILLNQFFSPFVLLLGIAAGLSFFFKEWLDGAAILSVILINAMIGFWMEFEAEKSMDVLKKLASVPARVVREGKLIEIPSEKLVPGDVLFAEAGDMIAADARLIQSAQLHTDESSLTGESLPVEKRVVVLQETVPLAERINMLYKGTHVSRGNGYGIVTHTGMQTEFGAIARMVQQAEETATPLEKKIRKFSKNLIWITVILVILIFIAGVLNGHRLVLMLKTSIALAVAAIPEGLPIVATLALAFGMLRMARHQVIVKKLSSVETLGGTTVICTDKTGTLTQNKIEAAFIQVDGLASSLRVDPRSASITWLDNTGISATNSLQEIYKVAVLCNTASFERKDEKEYSSGDPLEIGLLQLASYGGLDIRRFRKRYPKLDEIPFSPESKIMATLHKNEGYYVAAKGAVEELLPYCTRVCKRENLVPLAANEKEVWLRLAAEKASTGLRMLAFAFKNSPVRQEHFLEDLVLAGLVGFMDPPREEVPEAITECRNAGIKVVMITGDHPATAKNIADRLGLAVAGDEVIHGSQMKPYLELDEAEKEKWMKTPVFARVTPAQKLDLVSVFQEKKMVVGMTGDGVNDAPALKKADIGIAMGERGTQVAQEVADMVLKNDSFSSIVLAIKQGRVIFDNIRKFVIYLLSCNLSELFVVAAASVLNMDFQLFPLQILFINLVTDVLPALALGVTEAAPHLMVRKPYPSGTPIIDRKRWTAIWTYSFIITLTTIGAVMLSQWRHQQDGRSGELSNNVLFYTLIFSQIFHVFNMSFGKNQVFFRSEVFRNKYVWYAVLSCSVMALLSFMVPLFRTLLKISMEGWQDWGIVLGFSLLSLLLIQMCKQLRWVM
ncbi:MAG: cation-translocating P-type ATPase [Flavisolibacter sp.]